MKKLDEIKGFKLVENLDLVEEWNCDGKMDLEDWKDLGSVVNVEDLDLVDKLDLMTLLDLGEKLDCV